MTRRFGLAAALVMAVLALPAVAVGAPAWTALTVNDTANSVTPIATDTNAAAAAVGVGALPLAIAIAPDARTAYVVNLGASAGSGSIGVVDLTASAPRVRATVPITTGTPNFIAIAPNGAKAYVSNPGNGTVDPLDLTRDPPVAGTPFSAGSGPEGIAFTPDGSKAYVADLTGNAVIPVDVATDSPRAPIPMLSRGPFALAVTPDGRTLYVTDLNVGAVSPIDVATDTVGPGIGVGAQPQGIAITPDGGTAWVTSGGAGTVTPIDLATNTAGQAVAVGNNPYAIAVTPDGRRAYVSNGGAGDSTVVPVDLTTKPATPGSPIAVGTAPRGIAITPDQAPVASFTVASKPPGSASGFDASNSSVRFGSIASYRWSFGDGSPVVTTTTPATTHAYSGTGTFSATLTETTAAGTSSATVFTGQTASRVGSGGSATRRVAVVASTPSPVTGVRVTVETVSGSVRVRLPGTKTFVALNAGKQIPVGSIVDARRGSVRITATSGGRAYSAVFFEGVFQVLQKKRKGATTDLHLYGGNFKGCPRGVRAAARKRKSIRHLWGDGKGPFKTVGRFSSAAIRGTRRLTKDDQCTGTLTRVTVGAVTVRDFVKRRSVIVRAGKSYFARARG